MEKPRGDLLGWEGGLLENLTEGTPKNDDAGLVERCPTQHMLHLIDWLISSFLCLFAMISKMQALYKCYFAFFSRPPSRMNCVVRDMFCRSQNRSLAPTPPTTVVISQLLTICCMCVCKEELDAIHKLFTESNHVDSVP